MMDTYTVLWREMLVLKRTFWKFLISVLVGPFLYLVAFGWGLGRSVTMASGSYLDFVVPGIIGLSAMTTSFNGVGVYLNISKLYYHDLEEYQIAPITAVSFTLGKVLAGCVRGMTAALVILALGFLFGARLITGLWFFLIVLLTCFLFASLGVVAGMTAKSHEDMGNISTFVILPMSFLCGTFFSLDKLPKGINCVINMLPLTHTSYSLRALFLSGELLWSSIVVLAVYSVVLFAAGVVVMQKVR